MAGTEPDGHDHALLDVLALVVENLTEGIRGVVASADCEQAAVQETEALLSITAPDRRYIASTLAYLLVRRVLDQADDLAVPTGQETHR